MRYFIDSMIVAAAVVLTAACKMDVQEETKSSSASVQFSAGIPATRAAFSDPDGSTYPALWQQGDHVKLLMNGEEIQTGSTQGVLEIVPNEEGKKADFSADLSGVGEQGNYNFSILYPASAFSEADIFSGYVFVTIPSTQACSSVSVDPAAMLLWAEAGPFTTLPAQVSLSFHHMAAYGKLRLTNLSGTLQSVELVSDRELTGSFYRAPQEGTLMAQSAVKQVQVTTSNPDAIWFACAPGNWSGTTLQVSATTSTGTYLKRVTFPSGREMKAGQVACFTVDMEGASDKSDVFDENQIVLSFGAISDTHINSTSNSYAQKFTSALSQLKSRAAVKDANGLDAVVVAGDLTDSPSATETQTSYAKQLYESVLDPKSVPMIYTVGNHDANPSYWWTSETYVKARVMRSVLGTDYFLFDAEDSVPSEECRHSVVGGYHILSITPNGTNPVVYPFSVINWLDRTLQTLTEADPERYVFVNTHPMIENTCYGSLLGTPMGIAQSSIWNGNDSWATRTLTDVLKKYPQVVTFGGHLHFPLHDPRSIWQGDFTSFGCGSTRYMAIENGGYQDMKSSTVMNDCEQVSDGWLIQLDAYGNLRATALDFLGQAVIGKPYEISYPRADKTHLGRYGSNRAAVNQAPVIDASSFKLYSRQVGSMTSVTAEWASASDDEMVHHYVLDISQNGSTVVLKKYLADFYLHPQASGMKTKWTATLNSLPAGTYQMKVTAYDSWDASATAVRSFTIEGPEPVQNGLYADLDFTGGTITDSKGKLTITNRGATVGQMSVSHGGQTYTVPAMQAGESKFVECQFNEISSFDMADAFMSSGFSVEAMFVDKSSGAIHGVVCGTQYGGWGLAMRATGVPYFIVGENSYNTYTSVDATAASSTSDLTHAVCVYDVSAKKMHIYINGKLSSSQSISGNFYPGASPTYNRFCLGADISLTSVPDFQCTNMIITDAKFYVGALDAAAVQSAYTAAVNALKQ